MKPFQTLNYFELLEVPPSASQEDILAAFERQQALYAPDSVALYVLEDPAQVEELRKLLVEAMEILTDADLRGEYHQQLGLPPPPALRPRTPAEATPAERLQALVDLAPPAPEEALAFAASLAVPEAAAGLPAAVEQGSAPSEAPLPPSVAEPHGPVVDIATLAASAEPAEPLSGAPLLLAPPPLPARPPRVEPEGAVRPLEDEGAGPVTVRPREARTSKVEVSPEAEFNGELLRRVRESRGLSLQQVADRTRISSRHLESIEADRYKTLPATVYLRGMLMSLAKELGLDGARVARSYMDLVARATRPPPV